MSVKFQVQITDKYMYDFMLYHNYTHASGLLSAMVGVVALGVGIKYILDSNIQYGSVWILCAIVLLFVNPYSMKSKAKMQVNNTPMFQKPLEYELHEEGVTVRQDEAEAVTSWEEITKAVSTSNCILLYLGRVRAMILPKKCIGEQYEEVLKMIHTHMPPKKVKIR